MEVYVELALLENFCMDYCLLYGARWASKTPVGHRRLIVGAVFGACVGVLFPLLRWQGVLAVATKWGLGVAVCAVTVVPCPRRTFKTFGGWFMGLTFLSGGALYALFLLPNRAGTEMATVPIGIPFLFVGSLALFVKRRVVRRKGTRSAVRCRLTAGRKTVSLPAFFDTGNAVYFDGVPVSVIPLSVARSLGVPPVGKVSVHTVTGQDFLPVYRLSQMVIYSDGQAHTIKNVQVGGGKTTKAVVILHPDLAEVL